MDRPDNHHIIKSLISQLYAFAQEWRTVHARGQLAEADAAVQHYHATMVELWNLDWDADLHPEEELPDELMPEYYLTYWAQYRNFQRALSEIAIRWRAAQSRKDIPEANTAIDDYYSTLAQFFELARGDKRLLSPPQTLLPDEFMPAYYLEYKRSKVQAINNYLEPYTWNDIER